MELVQTYSLTCSLLISLMACGAGAITGDEPGPGDDGPGDDDVMPTYPTEHPRIYLTPNRARLEAALAANAPQASRFRRTVDQWVGGGDLWGFEAWNAALLGQLTGDAHYCTKAVEAIDAQVTAAEAKAAAGQQPEVANDSYLHIGELVGDVALVYDWCFEHVSQTSRTRWLVYANQAVWNVWNHADATWGTTAMPWSGWSVDNPSNNYYYSFLRATMLLGLATKGESPQAEDWISIFHSKVTDQLVPTFDADLVGGGSREGTGYGVSMRRLFDLYEIWHATTGERLATKTDHTQASIRAFMHQVMPTLDRVAPTGDHSRDSTAVLFDYHRNYLQELITEFPTDPVAGSAKTLLADSSVSQMAQSFMVAYDFLYDTEAVASRPLSGLGTAYHAEGIGQLYARSGWDTHATWVNLIAGPYTETHAHEDQGSIMIYKDGFLAYDPIIDSRSGIPQATTVHGLVRIDSDGTPVRQRAWTTSAMTALHSGAGWLHASADVTPAYDGSAAVQKVQRELIYLAPDTVIVYDRVHTASGTTQTWQLPVPVQPAISGAVATVTNAGHTLRVTRIVPSTAMTTVHDFRTDPDFLAGHRIDVQQPGGDNRYLHVLAVDGAVTSATAAGGNGVTVNLAGGRTVTASFSPDAVGGTLTIDGSTITLAAGVDTLPE
jgi:hypothetical protein